VTALDGEVAVVTGAGRGLGRAYAEALSQDLFGVEQLDVYPYLAHLLSLQLEGAAHERVQSLDPQALQTQYVNSLRRLLQVIGARQPLVVILDEMAGEDDGHMDAQRDPLQARREALLIASVCKQAAIKAGRVLTLPEMQALIEQLEQSQSPRTCPHGRPTMIRLGFEQLAREFGRQ